MGDLNQRKPLTRVRTGPCLVEGRGSCHYLANIQNQVPHSNDEKTYLELGWSYPFHYV